MPPQPVKKPLTVKLTIALEILSTFMGLGSGILLFLAPSGSLLGLNQTDILSKLPLGNFLLLGVGLFVPFGIVPAVVTWGLIVRRDWNLVSFLKAVSKKNWAWTSAVIVSAAEVIFIGIEITIIGVFGVTIFWFGVQVITLLILSLGSVRAYYSPGVVPATETRESRLIPEAR